jgi:hypothetical protein
MTIIAAIAFFYGGVAENKKKTTIASITFVNGFTTKKGDANRRHLF